jgi:hypothetical protein
MPTLTKFKYFIQQQQENKAIILDSDRLTRHKILNYYYEYLTPTPAINFKDLIKLIGTQSVITTMNT